MSARPCTLRPNRCLLAGLLALALAIGGRAQSDPSVPRYVQDSAYADSAFLTVAAAPAATLPEYERRLEALGTLNLRSRETEVRLAAADQLARDLATALALDSSYAYPFAALATVSVVAAPDSSWRIFTWQTFVNDSTYRCGGLLQTAAAPGAPVALLDSAQALGLERDFELRPHQWYGALYYNVHAFALADGRPAWLLFGYDADGFAHRRKVADVLTFSRRTGAPLFGREVFVGTERDSARRQARLVLEYRADARVGLNYDEALGGVVFDHLVLGPPVRRGGPPAQIPDGSYDGYVYEPSAGEWRWREEWFDRVRSAEPPRPAPVLGGEEERDLFGRARTPAAEPEAPPRSGGRRRRGPRG